MNDLDVLLEFLNDSPEAQEELGGGVIKNTADGVKVEVPEAIEQAKSKPQKPSKKTALTKAIPQVPEVKVPTGGVGLLLTIALLIVFAIIQAPGQDVSRLALIWQALIGQVKVSGDTSGNGSKYNANTPGSKVPSSDIIPNAAGGVYIPGYGQLGPVNLGTG